MKTQRCEMRRELAEIGARNVWFGTLLALTLLLAVGCSRQGEAKITGRHSDPAANLACAWKPGYSYLVRLELDQITDNEVPDPLGTTQHRVTFAQDCLLRVTNTATADRVGVDVEIISLEMDRAKGGQVALSFNSEQGGETLDDLGYIPVLQNMIGGHLRFLLSADGKVIRTEGLTEWIDEASGFKPAPARAAPIASVSTNLIDPNALLTLLANAPPTNAPPTNALPKLARQMVRAANAASNALNSASARANRGTVVSTLQKFFTIDHFKQILEFEFLPAQPVRVTGEWKTAGETPISSRNRQRYEADCVFAGWQTHGGVNCARINAEGKLGTRSTSTTNAQPSSIGRERGTLSGIVWVNPLLLVPAERVLDKKTLVSGDSSTRLDGTNVVRVSSYKSVRQSVNIRLLQVTPLQGGAGSTAPAAAP